MFSETGTPISPHRSAVKRRTALLENIQRGRPCPKRFKKSLLSIPEAGTSSAQQKSDNQPIAKDKSIEPAPPTSVDEGRNEQEFSSEQRSSESISENELLIGVDVGSQSSSHEGLNSSNRLLLGSHSLSSKDTSNSRTTGRGRKSVEKSNQPQTAVSHEPPVSKDTPNPRTTGTGSKSVEKSNQPQTTVRQEPPASKDTPNPRTTGIGGKSVERSNQPQSDREAVRHEPPVSKNTPKSRTSATSGGNTVNNPSKKQVSFFNPPPPTILYQDDSENDASDSSAEVVDQQTNPNRSNQRTYQPIAPAPNQRHDTVVSTSAPPILNPRIRVSGAKLPSGVQSYFSTNIVDVNNYSRTLGG